jgi:hypothetical protein
MRLLLLVLVAALAGTGCGYEADCQKIVEHTFKIGIVEKTQGMNEAQKKRFIEDAMARRPAAVKNCKERKPSKADVDCALAARTMAELAECK